MSECAPRLDTMEAPKRRGPRFAGLPLSHYDQMLLVAYARSIADLYLEMVRERHGPGFQSVLWDRIQELCAKAEGPAPVAASAQEAAA